MKNIALVLIFSFFEFIFTKEYYNNITKDNFKKKYNNPKNINKYYFVFSAKINENVNFAIISNYIKGNFFKSVNVYEYKTYTSKSIRQIKKTAINCKYLQINDESVTNFSYKISESNTKYLGLELILNYNLTYMTLTIVSKNTFNLNYNEEDTKNLYAFIPYIYSINVFKNTLKEIDFTILTEYMENPPFKEFNLLEYKNNDEIVTSYSRKANFKKGNNYYKLSDNVGNINYDNIKLVTFEFIPNYDLTNCKMTINGTKAFSERLFFNISNINSENKYENLKKIINYNFILPYNKFYSSIRAKENNLNLNIFESITIYCFNEYSSDYIGHSQSEKLSLDYKAINDESSINFKYDKEYSYGYIGIDIRLKYNINHLIITIVSDNKITLQFNKLNTKNLFSNIPYFYKLNVGDYINKYLYFSITSKYIENIPFKNLNVCLSDIYYDCYTLTTKETNFIKIDNLYEFNFFYKVKLRSNTLKDSTNIRLEFIPDYYLTDFTVKVNESNVYYNIANQSFKKVYENLKKNKIYYFIFPFKIEKIFYSSIRSNYLNNNIFDSIVLYEYKISNSQYQQGSNYLSIPDNHKIINNEYIIIFDTSKITFSTEYLGLEIKLNYDINYLTFSTVSDNNIDLNYNELSTKTLYPFTPYFYWIDITNNKNEEFNIILSAKSITNLFKSFNITEHKSKESNIVSNIKIVNFIKNKKNNLYEFTFSYKALYPTFIKYLSFDFISDYEVEDFKVKANNPSDDQTSDSSEDDDTSDNFYDIEEESFNKRFKNLKKSKTYNFVFTSEIINFPKFVYCSIRTNYLNNNNIFKSIIINSYEIYTPSKKSFIQMTTIPNNFEIINNKFVLNFETYQRYFGYKYLGLELKLNFDLDYLDMIIVRNSITYLEYNKLNIRTLYANFPYSYWFNFSKYPIEEVNVSFSTKYIENIPFKTFNITEHAEENDYFSPTIKETNFVQNNNTYELSVSYKFKYNRWSKCVSFDFKSEYELEDFKVKIGGSLDDDSESSETADSPGTKIFGLSVLVFALTIGGSIIFIASIIILVIFIIKKRRKANPEVQIVESSEQPLFPDSKK